MPTTTIQKSKVNNDEDRNCPILNPLIQSHIVEFNKILAKIDCPKYNLAFFTRGQVFLKQLYLFDAIDLIPNLEVLAPIGTISFAEFNGQLRVSQSKLFNQLLTVLKTDNVWVKRGAKVLKLENITSKIEFN